MDKSRRERRKEARLEKNTRKHQLWLQHQKDQRLTKNVEKSKSKAVNKVKNSFDQKVNKRHLLQSDTSIDKQSPKQSDIKEAEAELESPGRHDSVSSEKVEKKRSKIRNVKTGFEKFLEMDMRSAVISAEEDLELERKLAKKLKVKKGKLRGEDHGMNMLFEGIPSLLDSVEEEKLTDTEEVAVVNYEKRFSGKKLKRQKLSEQGLKDEMPEDSMVEACEPLGTLSVVKSEEISAKLSSRNKNKKRNKEKPSQQGLEGEIPGDSTVEVQEPLEPCSEAKSDEVSGKVSSRNKSKKRKLLDRGEEGNKSDDSTMDVSEPVVSYGAEVASKAVLGNAPGKYIAPHLRSLAGNESSEYTQIRRQVRRLLNKMTESNIGSTTGEISITFRSIARSIASQIISEEVLASCSGGPRGNEQYAAMFSAFVAGMACSVGVDFSANVMVSLAKTFEDKYLKKDDLALRNITLLLSYLYIIGICSSDLIYDFMMMLSKRLTEIDVSTIYTVLECCGMKIRADDPLAMKNFIQSVQNRVNELKASSGVGQAFLNNKRMEYMLEIIYDIKNNKKKPKEDPSQLKRFKKWLQKLGAENILLRGLKWSKLLDPDKKGQWWLSVELDSTKENVEEVAGMIDKEVLETQTMLQLAAKQRMNTDARRAIFCIIMSGEDYIDAFEKLLRLDLPGKQDREIMRVLVECCLQEKVFNKYYTVLASKLCEHEKNHKFTLQFCLWDHFKELESMELIRSMHLAKFVAEMVSSFTLSLAVLKAVDLNDIRQLTPKRIMHFRMLFEAIFEHRESLIWNIFTRVAVAPELESLRHGIEFFIKGYVVKTNNAVKEKFKVVKKALNNTEGVLM
ncbi:uncharacterized protein LOC107407676 isoform X1 [Ziziphus jujuba]|uniref:Nucleolar MIF4G domain-containing protein 1 isoform X1 n=1 Tax=Ziziphus jujuba TaxID=326968 RepID=A0A6P6FVQ6_ZIZJJ|nr:uncharacterized protein LOC107407676 isoform X1 [Ziziphus jujuba]XP_024925614.1 nucleolar MIF4G domain-containing protein 1 isoform X1 [Ziziphus jujuba var. spinosa]XP_024925615.1 uncharacterized protein LOC107407676 isoform X1 [Ziziphus jujuba]XP_048333339.1 uncharacterized protein LOC107407676 isoform X1 [Ziziphus jujuba]XP_048333340.1 uncharacterized protein LOC107407676 isoform X1 [Ziziphus jujuba]